MRDVREVLMHVKRLKEKAKANRDFGDLEEALDHLREATGLLEPYVEETEYMAKIRRELADCYGMMGGIFRRQGKLVEAEMMYRKGLDYEEDDSYNLSNSVVIPILIDPLRLENQQTKRRIQDGITTVQEQVRGRRKDEWWAWADLGLFNLLQGNKQAALEAYNQFGKVGARAQDYESTILVLDSLLDRLQTAESPSVQSVVQSVGAAINFLNDNRF